MSQNRDTNQESSSPARLALADGSVFTGAAFGDTTPRVIIGEACFNTALSGYQEVLTDPSYAGQIVAMTYPLIGNTGINEEDLESSKIQVSGFVVRELANAASNYRASQRLERWLADQGVTGVTGIDTRALTRKLRLEGAMTGVLCTDPRIPDEELVETAQSDPGLVGRNLVANVSITEPIRWDHDLGAWAPIQGELPQSGKRFKVVAIDCGAKLNILRNLTDQGCDVTVVSYDTPADVILKHEPDGLFVSNGPGDPAAVTATIETLKQIHGQVPTFGICLGHQLLSLALGATTFKLPFGHRGANHPIQNLATDKVEITSQNHGFAVDTGSLEQAGAEPTHINLNDRTLAGFRHRDLPIFAIQYHPEASPGPHDSRYLFDGFIEMMKTGQSPDAAQMDLTQRARNRVGSTN